MSHAHSHGSAHSHSHGSDADARRLTIALALILGLMVVEVAVGVIAHALVLLSDAGHMLTDVVAVFMGLAAVVLARRGSSSPDRTYGWHRAEVFTAVANALLLIGVATFILYEAVERLAGAPSIPGVPMVVVALALMVVVVDLATLLIRVMIIRLGAQTFRLQKIAHLYGTV